MADGHRVPRRLGIAELARNCVAIGKKYTNRASVTVSLGGFVPKPHTPFQWFGQNTEDELKRKINLVRDAAKKMPRVSRSSGTIPDGQRRRGHHQPRRPS